MLDVSDISDESFSLATLELQQGGTGLWYPLDIVNPAFVASISSSVNELQIAYPDKKDILADRQFSLPTVHGLKQYPRQQRLLWIPQNFGQRCEIDC